MAKILIVDDDKDFLQACETILKKEGYQVIAVNTVNEAEKAVKEGGLDLALLDIMMENPDDGIALAQKLKKENSDLPVIMLSGVSKVTGYEYKCDEMLPCLDFIEKPVTPDALVKKVKAVIEK